MVFIQFINSLYFCIQFLNEMKEDIIIPENKAHKPKWLRVKLPVGKKYTELTIKYLKEGFTLSKEPNHNKTIQGG